MTGHNRIGKLCLALAFIFVLLTSNCFGAIAAAPPDLSRRGSVTFHLVHNLLPVSGGSLRMVRVAELKMQPNGNYGYSWLPELADCGLDILDSSSETTARRLAMLVESRSLPGVTQVVPPEGVVTFEGLELGLYVVYQPDPAPGYEPINPFCISVPMIDDDGSYIYDISAAPKPRLVETKTSETEPSALTLTTPHPGTTGPTTVPGVTSPTTKPHTPTSPVPPDENVTEPVATTAPNVAEAEEPTTAPPKENLPQTGQLWWPVLAMSAGGMLLIVLGIYLRLMLRRETEEDAV